MPRGGQATRAYTTGRYNAAKKPLNYHLDIGARRALRSNPTIGRASMLAEDEMSH